MAYYLLLNHLLSLVDLIIHIGTGLINRFLNYFIVNQETSEKAFAWIWICFCLRCSYWANVPCFTKSWIWYSLHCDELLLLTSWRHIPRSHCFGHIGILNAVSGNSPYKTYPELIPYESYHVMASLYILGSTDIHHTDRSKWTTGNVNNTNRSTIWKGWSCWNFKKLSNDIRLHSSTYFHWRPAKSSFCYWR